MLTTAFFPDKLEITKVSPLYKRVKTLYLLITDQYHFCLQFQILEKVIFK